MRTVVLNFVRPEVLGGRAGADRGRQRQRQRHRVDDRSHDDKSDRVKGTGGGDDSMSVRAHLAVFGLVAAVASLAAQPPPLRTERPSTSGIEVTSLPQRH